MTDVCRFYDKELLRRASRHLVLEKFAYQNCACVILHLDPSISRAKRAWYRLVKFIKRVPPHEIRFVKPKECVKIRFRRYGTRGGEDGN